MKCDVIIVGAGLSGLSCALKLRQQGIRSLVLEASDGVGGRIRTDLVDGFQLDRGFQVFLTSYPEAQAWLDYDALELQPFLPGALVRFQGRFHELADPWRRPLAAIRSLSCPIGTLTDKWRIGRLRAQSLRGSVAESFQVPEMTSLQWLQEAGFSPSMIDRFFRPFLGGIFLDADLKTSNRMLNFVFRMFSTGTACLPAHGMEAIPRQLASQLPSESIRTYTSVAKIEAGRVMLTSGEELHCDSIVVAVDGPSASNLLSGSLTPSSGQGTTCLYFSAPKPPFQKPILVLNGDGDGPINNLCVPSNAAPSYGPQDQNLVSVTVLGAHAQLDTLRSDVLQQLHAWYGDQVDTWRHVKTYCIPYALPTQAPPALQEPERSVRWSSGIYVCGDHRDNASIQGAMVSGRRTAETILHDRSSR